MFYQAAPHEVFKVAAGSPSINQANTPTRPLPMNSMRSISRSRSPDRNYLDTHVITNTADFAITLEDNDELEKCTILSITWVKALASPLSHEYIQFIVHSSDTGKRHRLVAERSDIGDLVTVGWDWSSGNYASHHHVLPLPLLTLSYEDLPTDKPPTIKQFANILHETSEIRPYNLMREMCWWYAEKVFVETSRKFPDTRVKQWPFANLRYSFVVRSEWIRRPALADAAEKFRVMNVQKLAY
ncbi:hypothetical protein LTS08_001287 [Lithohypha guttulata]|uniref:uncharacterized protein n=1 Tax=Lithohypha guttulata TaxID=1690604 RepID=UPI002DE1B2D5|nr:hypothetical protein LTR51_007712 [Lithohypha guttulata]KAK5105014.1 hypothetical protein LTS08_001287 [Lithohypha guttulata]